jgi:hypothetical protein
MFRQISIIVGIAALVVAAPASASVTIDFGGGNSPTVGATGNIAAYSNGPLAVQASAWMFNGYSVETAFLGQYSNGLGVTNSGEGAGTLPSSNAIDNTNGYDFVLLVFNQPVSLLSAVLTPYQLGVGQPDNDATIAYANFTGLFTSPTPTAVATSSPLWGALASTAYSVAGNNSSPFSTAINPGTTYGNTWLVSADILGLDRSPDGFRLSSITANTSAVPEPSTWMAMLLGFCGIGSVLRRTRGAAGKLAQIA